MSDVPLIAVVEAPTQPTKRRVRFSMDTAADSASSRSNSALLGSNLASPAKGDNVFRPRRERWFKDAEERMKRLAAPSTSSPASQSKQIHVNQYLACAALGLDYLCANLQQGHRDPTPAATEGDHIEVDDLLVAVEAPWSLAAEHHLTLQELFCIMETFISTDPRFSGKYEASCLSMHVRRTESTTTSAAMMDDDVCARERPLSLSAFRQCLSEDALTFDRFKIICFEPELLPDVPSAPMEHASSPSFAAMKHHGPRGDEAADDDGLDKEEREAAERLIASVTAVSGCALVTEIQRSRGTVQIAQVIDGEVRRSEVLARSLYTACTTRHKELRRVQGIIDVRRQGSTAATNVEVSVMVHDIASATSTDLGGSAKSQQPSTYFEAHTTSKIPCIYGTSWRRQTSWRSNVVPYAMHDTTVLGSHLTATALAFHLCNPTKFPEIPLNKLAQVAGLSLVDLSRTSCPEVNSWCGVVKYFAEQTSPETTVHFLPTNSRRSGLSLQQLIDLVLAICVTCSGSNASEEENVGGDEGKKLTQGTAALIVALDVNKARGSLNLTSAELNDNVMYALVGGISESGEQILLVDGDTRHSEISWTIAVEQLHGAIVGNGVLLIRQTADGADLLQPGDRKELLEAEKLLLPYRPRSFVVSASESRALPTPIGLCCMACERIGHTNFQKRLMQYLPCNVSHLLVNDPSVEDLSRVINFVSAAKRSDDSLGATEGQLQTEPSLELVAENRRVVSRAVRLEVNRVKQRKLTGSGFAHAVRNALACNSQILFHFKRSLLANIPKYEGAASQYALAEALTSHDTIVLQDTNPRGHLSRWQCSLAELYKACSADCCATRRPGGLVIISSHASAEDAMLVDLIRSTRRFSPFFVPSSHAFRSPLVPQLTAVAMAARAIGVRICPEQLLYRSAQSSNMTIADTVAHIITLQRRLSVSDLCLVCNSYFDDNGSDLKLSIPHGSTRTGRLTKTDVQNVLSELPTLDHERQKLLGVNSVVVGVYDVREAKDVADAFSSAGVLVGLDSHDSNKIVLVEADPASWGMFVKASVEEAVEWFCKAPDDVTAHLFGLCVLTKTQQQQQQQQVRALQSGWSSDDDA